MDEESELPHREQKIKGCTSIQEFRQNNREQKAELPKYRPKPERNTEGNTSYFPHIKPNRANEVTDGKARK